MSNCCLSSSLMRPTWSGRTRSRASRSAIIGATTRLHFIAPKAAYAATGAFGMQSDEASATVKELHRHGIEVMLDVVFNHTAEGNEYGPTISFRGIDNRIYYMLTPDGHYYNFSGCGNTLNCNHPVVREFVLECLRHWVADYHIDGFRFDLASILGRDQSGARSAIRPCWRRWPATRFWAAPNWWLRHGTRAACTRSEAFLPTAAGRNGMADSATAPASFLKARWGKSERWQLDSPARPICTTVAALPPRSISSRCHDGFTLADLVAYNEKHNEANGEQNRDGANDNYSWNCGLEGPTDDPQVLALRQRQMKNALAILLVAQGVPMLLMGDECGRTQLGNNNAYCHDGPLTWLDWQLLRKNSDLLPFCKRMIQFRHEQPMLRSPWHGGPARPNLRGTAPGRTNPIGQAQVACWRFNGRSQAPTGDRASTWR